MAGKKEENEEKPEEILTGKEEEPAAQDEAGKEEGKEKAAKARHKKESHTEKLEEELAQWKDKYVRLYSEFDNYRKRTLKEKIELSKTASAEIITALLPVVDDLERALRAYEAAEEENTALKDGILLIYNKWMNILQQEGLEVIPAIGEDFDTDIHEAVTKIPAPDPEQKGKIVDEIQKGYKLNGKVIRFAKVVVGD